MKRYRFLFLFLLFFAHSCSDQNSGTGGLSENNIDAARNFIRAALDGKFNAARKYLLDDSLNVNYMDVAERNYQRADPATKDGYRTASITILQVQDLIKDSVSVVIYSNTFKKDPDTLKVIKSGGTWLVDLKYLYEHGQDSLLKKPDINKIP